MVDIRPAGVPTGACVAASYGQGIAPVGSGLALAPSGAVLIQSNDDEWEPPFELDTKHCQYVRDVDGKQKQCGSYPIKDDPDLYCAGHRNRRLKAEASDSDAESDANVCEDAPRP